MSEEEIIKYITVTNDKVIIDKNFYNKVLLPCMDKGVNFKNILTKFEKWLEERINSPKLSLIEIITFKRCLEELQELKEGKK